MSEPEELNREEDMYADMKLGICDTCRLPKTISVYELGMRMLQGQMIQFRADLQQLVNKIDELEHNRNL
jgi:hypothetical protein